MPSNWLNSLKFKVKPEEFRKTEFKKERSFQKKKRRPYTFGNLQAHFSTP